MAMQYIDVTGKTESEAIERALEQLGMDRDDVSVEILERAKSGFLGIGSSPAKVRVTYEAPQEPAQPEPARREPARREPARPEEPPVREERPREKREERRPREKQDRQRPDGQRPEKPQRPAREDREEARRPQAAPAAAPEDLGEEVDDEKARQIRAFLTGLLEHMDSAAHIRIYLPEKDRYKVFLDGEKMGQLIGRRGETLDAIQQLTNYVVNRDRDKRVRIHVDAENYREKREQSLEHLARKTAAKAVKYRRNVTLEPMNAYERHVIHTALQDVEHVTTYSTGSEPNRRVVVAYEK